MLFQEIAPVGERIVLNMSDGVTYTGHFNSLTYPFASFFWDETGHTLYINTDNIVSLSVLEEDGNPSPPTGEQIGNILGKHSTEVNGKS